MKYNKGTSRKNREKHVKGKRVIRVASFKMKVKKGDTVKVVAGKDKGKQGAVLAVFPKENKVVVEGIALVKRHLRRTGSAQSGRIVERPAKIHASNVMRVVDGTTTRTRRAAGK